MSADALAGAQTEPTATVGTRALVRIPDFRRLWAAGAISDLGDALTTLALLLVVHQLTGSAAAIAAMAIVLALPAVLFGVIAGSLVDRWDRRRVMLVADLVRAGLVLGFVLVDSTDRLWLLYLLGFAQATVGAFFAPARMALTPHIVPAAGLLAANSLGQMTRLVAGVLGSAAAGVMATAFGVVWPAFVIDAATFIISFLLVLRIDPAAGVAGETVTAGGGLRGVLRASMEGLRVVAASRLLAATLLATAVVMLGLGAVNVLFVPFLIEVLDVSPAWFGAVELAQASSMVLSALLVATLFARSSPSAIVTIGLAVIAVLIAAVSQVADAWQLVLLLFLVGWAVSPVQAAVATIIQTGAADAVRGRVASLLNMVIGTTTIASMALGGLAAEAVGIRTVFLLAGAIAGLGALIAGLVYRTVPRTAPGSAAPVDGDRAAMAGA